MPADQIPITDTSWKRHEFPLSIPFEIARGGAAERTGVVSLRIRTPGGSVGVGAAAPASYYGEDVETVAATLPTLLETLVDIDDAGAHQRIATELAAAARNVHGAAAGAGPAHPAARAAVSIAVHDLAAKRSGEALYRRLGLDPEAAPQTSMTVGIGEPEAMAESARTAVANGYDVLKIKLGTDDDRPRFEAVRDAVPDARLRVDANEAWEPAEAVRKSDWLAAADVEFVEQPVPAHDIDGLAHVSKEASLPVAADEACPTARAVPAVADATDVVVVKLMKCGGIRPACRQIATAHAHGLDVMLGCMVETNASIAAAWHLAPLVEYADLDGAALLAEDTYEGIEIQNGGVYLPRLDRPGTGARVRAENG